MRKKIWTKPHDADAVTVYCETLFWRLAIAWEEGAELAVKLPAHWLLTCYWQTISKWAYGFIWKHSITKIFKTELFFSWLWFKTSDWAHKLNRKIFAEAKTESSFPIDFYRTRSLFAVIAITIWWPSDRM